MCTWGVSANRELESFDGHYQLSREEKKFHEGVQSRHMGLFTSDDKYPDRQEYEVGSQHLKNRSVKYELKSEVCMHWPESENSEIAIQNGELYNLVFTDSELVIPTEGNQVVELMYDDMTKVDLYEELMTKESVRGGDISELYASILRIIHSVDGIETHVSIANNLGGYSINTFELKDEESEVEIGKLEKIESFLQEVCNSGGEENPRYILNGLVEQNASLTVEDWNRGGRVSGNMGGQGQSKGKSSGVQVGPFIRSKTKSNSEFEGDFSGSVTGTNFSSTVNYIEVTEGGIFADSNPVLDISYEEIDKILERDRGMTIMWGDTTIQLTSIRRNDLSEPLDFIRSQVDKATSISKESEENTVETSKKLRELKELQDDGIITSEEFEQKKKELLDDF